MKRLITRFLFAADTRKMTPPFHNRIRKVCSLRAATLIIPALAISFALPTCAQQKETLDAQAVEKADPLAGAVAQTTNEFRGLKEEAQAYGIFLEEALMQTASEQTANELVGTWTLVSITLEQDGKKTDMYGPNPQGQLM